MIENRVKRHGGLTLMAGVQGQSGSDISPEMCLYRERTAALLRKYCRLSVELGRVPALLGREFFRSRVTSYRMHSFEDVVIFVYDVERCLEKLDEVSKKLIARIGLQEYTHEEAAKVLGYNPRTVERRYPEALDRLSAILLKADLLRESSAFGPRERRLPPKKNVGRAESCQEGKILKFAVNR
jgi:Sigma-70, region 4